MGSLEAVIGPRGRGKKKGRYTRSRESDVQYVPARGSHIDDICEALTQKLEIYGSRLLVQARNQFVLLTYYL